MNDFPWRSRHLRWWSIVGMNHYRKDGVTHLFVAMTWKTWCIKTEGRDDQSRWDDLAAQAAAVMGELAA